jgi:tripartite-type tricarboxylate transporter receptor subunit TctC
MGLKSRNKRRVPRLVHHIAAFCALAYALYTVPLFAAWPDRTITIIVHFAPGGVTDILARMIAADLAPMLGTSVIVVNRPGANGDIGLTAAARAAPDGNTLVLASSVLFINPSMAKVAYDPAKDFAPVAYLGAAPTVLVAGTNSEITSIQDLVQKAKANPGKITYSSPGLGSTSQLAVELLKVRTGIDVIHVPYSGAAPALQAAIAGTTDLASVGISGLVSQITSGRARALGQSGRQRWPELPNIPTFEEAGIDNVDIETGLMLLAPANTPDEVVDRLSAAVRQILEKAAVKDLMFKMTFAVKYETPAELRARFAREIPMWEDIVAHAGIKKN